MSGLEQFQIFLDNPPGVYFSGQTISGHIDVQLRTAKRLRGIQVKFKGEAEVRWTERRTTHHNKRSHTHHQTYYAKEQYFNAENFVLGGPGNDMTLPVGKHVFPFSLVLPLGLPSSFEGEYGHVRYTIKAVIDRPWKFNHEAKAIFTIIQHLDLNAELAVKQPVQLSAEKHLCCLWCRSGPISVMVSLPATGYVAGQEIPMTVMTDNVSNESLQVSASLLQTSMFRATSKSRHTEHKVSGIDIGQVSSHGSGSWETRLMVPPVPPSFLRNCNIIDITYRLEVKVHIAGPHKNLSVEVPIMIGTIPLVTYPPSSGYPSAPQITRAEVPPAAWGHEPSAPNYPDIDPPTYEECAMGKKDTREEDDNEYTRGDMGFAPRYPTYQFGR